MDERIISPDDERLAPFANVADPKRVREQGLFVAEGRRVVEAVLRGGFDVRRLLLTRAAREALSRDLARVSDDVEVLVVDGPSALKAITGHRFHQGCLGLVGLPTRRDLDDLPRLVEPGARLVVALEGVTDPDNVGTIFRSACGFGSAACLLGPGCAHPLYRKSLRTSLGNVLRLPFAHPRAWPGCLARLSEAGYVVMALTPSAGAVSINDVLEGGRPERVVLLLGSEERGLEEATLDVADVRVRIPMDEVVDSLNVAATAAIALHRLYRSPDASADGR